MARNIFHILAFSIAATLAAGIASAATTDVQIRLRPTCQESAAQCSEFPQYDGDSLTTYGLNVGDTLDLEVVISNPSQQPIQSIQSWLAYDATVLEGIEVRIDDAFPLVAPNEKSFAPEMGVVRMGASNVAGGVRTPEIRFARVQFRVLKEIAADAAPQKIPFFQFELLGAEGKTKALIVEGGKTVNVLRTRPLDLRLYFGEDAQPPTVIPPVQPPVPQPPTTPPGTPPPSSQPPPTVVPPIPVLLPPTTVGNDFVRMQPTGLGITTQNDQVYIRWDRLMDPRVAGYNVYYGTVSGRYVHRKTLTADVDSVTVGGLPTGQRYYFAVTAFSTDQSESQYSQEVAVVVGDPQSSTAPFTLTVVPPPGPPPQNVIGGTVIGGGTSTVPGATGISLWILGLILSIAIGVGILRSRGYRIPRPPFFPAIR